MDSKFEEANRLCYEIYGQTYYEVFGYENVDAADIDQNLLILQRKNKYIGKKDIYNKDIGTFLDIWRKYWNSVVVKQPILCELYCMCAMSQLLKHVRVIRSGGIEDDIRVNIASIMPSGTGKSEGNDVLSVFARQVGLVYGTVDRYNDASLVGSINRQAIDFNIKHGKMKGDDGYIDPDEKGILRKSDFVVFDEGENILKTTKETEGAQRYLQKAMNRYGSESNFITNSLVGYTVGGHPDCSIVITSYYLEEFRETLLDRGLLQRMIVYIQEEDYDIRTSIIDTIVGSIPSFVENQNETTPVINKMRETRIDNIQAMRDEALNIKSFHLKTEVISIKYSVKDIINAGISELRNLMPFYIGQKQIWESMITRMTVNLLKVAAVHALINYRTYIDEQDARYASALMMRTMTSMAFFLREKVTTEADKKTINLHQVLRRKHIGEKLALDKWVTICIEEFNMRVETAKKMLTTLIENGKMEEIKVEGKRAFILK